MAGRKPIPRNLRLVTGNTRPDRMNDDEPQPEVCVPAAPDYLVGDELWCFMDTAKMLSKMHVMTDADVDALSVYAVNFARWKEATAKIRESSMVVKSQKGTPMQNPYLKIANVAQRECLRILAEFGLTPSSRTRVRKD